jgi:hypothetical protein
VRFQEPPQFVRASVDSLRIVSAYKEHADECRTLAKGAESSDRSILLKMAGTWDALARRPRMKTRALWSFSHF